MKYIPGYTFTVGAQKRKSVSLLQLNLKHTIKDPDFESGKTYTLNYLKPLKDKVVYTFVTEGKKIELTFASINEAENRISTLSGEQGS